MIKFKLHIPTRLDTVNVSMQPIPHTTEKIGESITLHRYRKGIKHQMQLQRLRPVEIRGLNVTKRRKRKTGTLIKTDTPTRHFIKWQLYFENDRSL